MKIFNNKSLLFLVFLSLVCIISFSCRNKPTPPEETEITPIEPEMVFIDEDLTFTYGEHWGGFEGSTNNWNYDSLAVITLEPYYIAIYELTNKEFFLFVADNGYEDSTFWSEEGWTVKKEKNILRPLYWDKNRTWQNDPYSNDWTTPVHGICYYEAEAYCS